MLKLFYVKQFSLASVEFQCQKQFHFKQFSLAQVRNLNLSTQFVKNISIWSNSVLSKVLIQTIQFNISMQFSSIWPIDRTLSGATTLDQSWPGRDGNIEVLCIPQSSRITGTSPSDC